ncbi:unnamed protein product [Echinostoma caproni]|uniref:UCH domain-containing protein n=1 Tax=Echinostoma caproni TaxID=27848 RepID=A0A183ALD1_9TREM|nr:unnamed protein product [Echinostoma caproni]
MIQEMLNLFSALINTEGGAISSKPLTDSFGWTEDEVCVHQDIQELNRLLFEQIEIALKGTTETNLINDLYRGVQCTRDEFQDINLSVMDHDSVEASLVAHTQLERLTGENQYFCEACQCKVDAVKKAKYNLFSIVLHVGGSTGGGHYHAYIKDPYGTVRESNKDSASANGEHVCKPIENPINERDHNTGRKKVAEGDFHSNIQPSQLYTKIPFNTAYSPVKDTSDKPHSNEHVSWKPQPSGGNVNRLPSPPLLSNLTTLDRKADQTGKQDLSLGRKNLLKMEDRAQHYSRTSSYRNEMSNVGTISELVGRLKSALSIENDVGMKDKGNKAIEQRVRTGQLTKSTTRHKRFVPNSSYECDKKPSPKLCRKKPREQVKIPKPSPLTRQLRTSSFRDGSQAVPSKSAMKSRKPRRIVSTGFPALQTSQHNSGSQQTASSTTSSSGSPVVGRPSEKCAIPPIPAYSSTRCGWRSRLFEGVSSEDAHNSKVIQSDTTRPPLYCGDPMCSSSPVLHRSAITTDRTLFSDDSSGLLVPATLCTTEFSQEPNDNLNIVPAMQRMDAKLPSKWSYSCEMITGLSQVNSRTTLVSGRSANASDCCDGNTFNRKPDSFEHNVKVVEEEENGPSRQKLNAFNTDTNQVTEEVEMDEFNQRGRKPRDEPKVEYPRSSSSTEIRVRQTEVVIGRWFDFNDDYIVEVDPSMFSRVFEGPECAYMLFYRRTNLPSPIMTSK